MSTTFIVLLAISIVFGSIAAAMPYHIGVSFEDPDASDGKERRGSTKRQQRIKQFKRFSTLLFVYVLMNSLMFASLYWQVR